MPQIYSKPEVYNIIRQILIMDYEGYRGPYETASFWEPFVAAHNFRFHVYRSAIGLAKFVKDFMSNESKRERYMHPCWLPSELMEQARRVYHEDAINKGERARSPNRKKLRKLVHDDSMIHFVGDEAVPARTIEQHLAEDDEVSEEGKW